MRVVSETDISNLLARQRVIRSLELQLEILEHGLAMPRDEDAIARTQARLKEAERAGRQS
jgi:hypothetical protein